MTTTGGKLAYGTKKRINQGDGEDYEIVDRVHGL